MFARPSSLPYRAGFTLIELIVAITIMILVLGGGIAGYVNFNSRQQLISSGQDVTLLMRAAQKKARVGERPTGCTKLLGYQVKTPSGNLSQVDLVAQCDSGPYVRDSITLPSGVTVKTDLQMEFQVLHGGVENPGSVVLVNASKQYSFDVDQGGSVSEGVLGDKQ